MPQYTKPRPKTGGRVKGKPNKLTRDVKTVIAAFVERTAERAQQLWEKVAKDDPARALEIWVKFGEFVLPKLQRTEMRVGTMVPLPTEVITDASQAADIYQRMLGDLTMDIASVRFGAAPLPALEHIAAPAEEPTP